MILEYSFPSVIPFCVLQDVPAVVLEGYVFESA